jgi:hypothetical protein
MRRLLRRLGDPHTHYPVRLTQPSIRFPLAPTDCCLLAGEDHAILLVKCDGSGTLGRVSAVKC